MPVSAVSICSNAALLNGDAPFSSFEDAGDRVRLMANLYEHKRDALLRSHPWNCAIKRVILSPAVTPPAFDWKCAFNVPGDWLRTMGVGLDGQQDDYVMEMGPDGNRQILMNSSICRLRYVFRNEVEATWDASLVEAMTQIMAATTAYALTKSASLTELELDIIKNVLKRARAVDGQEGTAETFGDSPLLAHRLA